MTYSNSFLVIVILFLSAESVTQSALLNKWRIAADSIYNATGYIDKRFERMYAMAAPRASGRNLKSGRKSLFEISAELHRSLSQKANNRHNGKWEFVGGTSVTYTNQWARPGGGVGRVNCIEFHPSNPNTFLVGTVSGGIWKTTDHGSTWESITDGFPSLSVSSIEYNPIDTNEIFALIGDGDGGHSNFRTLGVLRTQDSGESWYATNFLSVGASASYRSNKLIIDPRDPSRQYLNTSRGVFKTEDNWESNDPIFAAGFATKNRAYDLEFRPDSYDTVYFSTGTALLQYSYGEPGVVDTLMSYDPNNINSKRIEFEVSQSDPDKMYALQGQVGSDTTGFAGFFYSSDAGQTWMTNSLNSPNIMGSDTLGDDERSQAIFDIALAIHPSDPSRALVGGINTWASQDTGVTWACKSYFLNNTSFPYLHSDIHDLVYNGNNLYACTDGGLSMSLDHGDSWVDIGIGLGINQIYRLTSSFQDPNIIYGGLQDNGNNRYYPDGHMDQVTNSDGMECAISPQDSMTVYVCTQRGRLLRSDDGGDIFTTLLSSNSNKPWTTPLEMHPTSPDTLLFGHFSGQLLRSFDKMTSRNTINCGETPLRLRFAPSDPNTVYNLPVGRRDTIWRSDNILGALNSVTFYPLSLDTSRFYPTLTDLAVDPADKEHIFVTYSSFSDSLKVLESEDGGVTWNNISGALPNLPINCIVYEAGSNDGIYVGTDVGVYYRDDDIGGWIWFGNLMPSVIVNDLEINYSNRTILAGTFGRGIWRSNLYANCTDVYLLVDNDNPYTGTYSYEAGGLISSSQNIQGGIGTNVQYQAGGFIKLTPGFRASKSTFFEARIGPCSGIQTNAIASSLFRLKGRYVGVYPYKKRKTLISK